MIHQLLLLRKPHPQLNKPRPLRRKPRPHLRKPCPLLSRVRKRRLRQRKQVYHFSSPYNCVCVCVCVCVSGGLFSDDEDDLFSTPSLPPPKTPPTSAKKEMTQAEKDALRYENHTHHTRYLKPRPSSHTPSLTVLRCLVRAVLCSDNLKTSSLLLALPPRTPSVFNPSLTIQS